VTADSQVRIKGLLQDPSTNPLRQREQFLAELDTEKGKLLDHQVPVDQLITIR